MSDIAVRDIDSWAGFARLSSCARRSGGSVSGSVECTRTATFGPKTWPARIKDVSSVGGGGAVTTTRVVSAAAAIRSRVNPVESARDV